jgi:hypothetical protein
VGNNAFEMVAVFSCGGGFNTMAGPGFFVPVLRAGFLPCGEMRRKKGWREWVGKITEWSEAQRSNFDLLISSGWEPGFLRRFALRL